MVTFAFAFLVSRIKIHHTTTYRYGCDVVLQPHLLMLRPRGSQDLMFWRVRSPAHRKRESARTWGVFGNLIATATFTRPTIQLVIKSEASVEQSAATWPVFPIAPSAHSFPFEYAADDAIDMGVLLAAERPDRVQVREWAAAFVRSTGMDTLSLLKDINAGVLWLRAIEYRDVVEPKKAALEDIRALGVLTIDPPAVIEQELVKDPLQEIVLAAPALHAFGPEGFQRRKRVDWRIHIAEIPVP